MTFNFDEVIGERVLSGVRIYQTLDAAVNEYARAADFILDGIHYTAIEKLLSDGQSCMGEFRTNGPRITKPKWEFRPCRVEVTVDGIGEAKLVRMVDADTGIEIVCVGAIESYVLKQREARLAFTCDYQPRHISAFVEQVPVAGDVVVNRGSDWGAFS